MLRGLSEGVELLHFAKDQDNSEWYVAQLAISGIPCVPFSVAAPDIAQFKDEASLMSYLERKAAEMIEVYGDCREPKQEAFAEYMEA